LDWRKSKEGSKEARGGKDIVVEIDNVKSSAGRKDPRKSVVVKKT